jgi:hypothetical protein
MITLLYSVHYYQIKPKLTSKAMSIETCSIERRAVQVQLGCLYFSKNQFECFCMNSKYVYSADENKYD